MEQTNIEKDISVLNAPFKGDILAILSDETDATKGMTMVELITYLQQTHEDEPYEFQDFPDFEIEDIDFAFLTGELIHSGFVIIDSKGELRDKDGLTRNLQVQNDREFIPAERVFL